MFGLKNNAFGMVMPERSFSNEKYRWGFNGQGKDNEVKGLYNTLEFSFRTYDPRIGKFFSVDPVRDSFPSIAPYTFAENRVIDGIDWEGKEYYQVTNQRNAAGRITSITIKSHRDASGNLQDLGVAAAMGVPFRSVMILDIRSGSVPATSWDDDLNSSEQTIVRSMEVRRKQNTSTNGENYTNGAGVASATTFRDGTAHTANINLDITVNVPFVRNSATLTPEAASLLTPVRNFAALFPTSTASVISNGRFSAGTGLASPVGGPLAVFGNVGGFLNARARAVAAAIAAPPTPATFGIRTAAGAPTSGGTITNINLTLNPTR